MMNFLMRLKIKNMSRVGNIEQYDFFSTHLGKPSNDFGEIISPINTLFFTRQHTRSINERDAAQYATRNLTSLETTQKGHTKAFQATKWHIRVNRQRVSRNRAFFWSIYQD